MHAARADRPGGPFGRETTLEAPDRIRVYKRGTTERQPSR